MEKLLALVLGDLTRWVPPTITTVTAVVAVWWVIRGFSRRFAAMETAVRELAKAVEKVPDVVRRLEKTETETERQALELHDARRDARDYVTRLELVDGLGRTGSKLHDKVDNLTREVDAIKRTIA